MAISRPRLLEEGLPAHHSNLQACAALKAHSISIRSQCRGSQMRPTSAECCPIDVAGCVAVWHMWAINSGLCPCDIT
eukprot:264880-Amphidinium_carterae.1